MVDTTFGKQCWDLREVDRLKAVSVRNGYNMHWCQDATNSAAQFISLVAAKRSRTGAGPVLTVKPQRRAKVHEGEYQGRDRRAPFPHAAIAVLATADVSSTVAQLTSARL